MTQSKFNTIFLDIETQASEAKPDVSEVKVPASYKKPESILAYQEEHLEEYWMKTALDPFEGRIYCVGITHDNLEDIVSLHGDTEKDTLLLVKEYLERFPFGKIVAHNGNEFDFRWLFLRSIKHGLKDLALAFSGKSTYELVDTMRMADGSAWKTMASLDKLCKLIGIEGKGDINGSMVPQMILQGKGKEVQEYCKDDIYKLRKVYLALGGYIYENV